MTSVPYVGMCVHAHTNTKCMYAHTHMQAGTKQKQKKMYLKETISARSCSPKAVRETLSSPSTLAPLTVEAGD